VLVSVIYMILMLSVVWRKFSRFRISFDIQFWKYLIKLSYPFAFSAIFITIYYSMDSVMLGLMGRHEDVGWYNAAYKPILFLTMINSFLVGSTFPVMSRLFKESIEQLKTFLNNYMRFILIIAVPIALGGALLGEKLILLMFSEEYIEAVLAFQILIFTLSIILVSVIFGNSIQACDRAKTYMWGVGLGAIFNIVLNLILIPSFSLYGAAIATLVSELVVLIYMSSKLNQTIKVYFLKYLFKPVFSSVIMVVILNFIDLNFFIMVIIGVIIYLGVMLVVKGIRLDEIKHYKSIIIGKYE